MPCSYYIFIVVEKIASLPRAVANSANVFNAAGDELTKLAIAVAVYDKVLFFKRTAMGDRLQGASARATHRGPTATQPQPNRNLFRTLQICPLGDCKIG